MRRFLLVGAAIALLPFLSGCDTTGPVTSEPAYVVQSFQEAGEEMKRVLVSRTASVDTVYNFNELAVSGAEVRVELLREDGSVEQRYPFYETGATGVYRPQRSERVKPLHTYRLHVEIPTPEGTETLTTTTVVPDTFRLAGATADTVVYQGEEQLALNITRSAYPDRQNVFVFTTEALGVLRQDRLTPLLRQILDEDDVLEAVRRNSSPILNEANYTTNPDGTLTIRLPWIAIAFYGRNRVSVSAIDDNLLDFIRSGQAQQGGSTLAPGEIPNILDHVEGGTGLFGSYARVGYGLYIGRSSEN